MYRGTTPTLLFTMPFNSTGITVLYVTFQQEGKNVLEKALDDVEWEGNEIKIKLTQEDTLKLGEGDVMIQIRLKFEDDTAMASDIIYTFAQEILKGGEI